MSKYQHSHRVEEFKVLARRITVGLVGEDRTAVSLLIKSCSDVGVKTFHEFTRGKDLLGFTKRRALTVLMIMNEIGDMHWSTLIRTLRADPSLPYFPLVLFLPKQKDSDMTMMEDRKNLDFVSSYGLKVVNGLSASPDRLIWLLDEVIRDEKNVESIQNQISAAKEAFSRGMADQARKLYASILKERRENMASKAGLMQTYENEPEHYKKILDEVLEQDPENYSFQFHHLGLLLKNKHVIQARSLMTELITQLQTSDETFWLTNLGEVCIEHKADMFVDEVVKTLGDKVEASSNWQVPYLEARRAIADDDLTLARGKLEQAISVSGEDHAELQNLNGIILKRTGHPKEALQSFRNAFRLLPDDHRIAYNLGLIYEILKERKLAETYYENAIALDPSYDKAKSRLDNLRNS